MDAFASGELQQPPEGTREFYHIFNQQTFEENLFEIYLSVNTKSHNEPPLHPTESVYAMIQPVSTNEQQEGGRRLPTNQKPQKNMRTMRFGGVKRSNTPKSCMILAGRRKQRYQNIKFHPSFFPNLISSPTHTIRQYQRTFSL